MDEESEILRVLAELEQSYRTAAQPYVDRLAAIRAMRLPTIYINMDCIDPEVAAALLRKLEA